ncbi:MAG: lasso RiPP family leader peptide-containing protein [Polyangiaceae bacterium]|jgi:hypothetical protein
MSGQEPQAEDKSSQSRRPYEAPVVRKLGAVRDLTRGSGTIQQADTLGNNSKAGGPGGV